MPSCYRNILQWDDFRNLPLSEIKNFCTENKIDIPEAKAIDKESFLDSIEMKYKEKKRELTPIYKLKCDIIHDSKLVDTKIRRMRDKDIIREGT